MPIARMLAKLGRVRKCLAPILGKNNFGISSRQVEKSECATDGDIAVLAYISEYL
jgi:hypothetical protein